MMIRYQTILDALQTQDGLCLDNPDECAKAATAVLRALEGIAERDRAPMTAWRACENCEGSGRTSGGSLCGCVDDWGKREASEWQGAPRELVRTVDFTEPKISDIKSVTVVSFPKINMDEFLKEPTPPFMESAEPETVASPDAETSDIVDQLIANEMSKDVALSPKECERLIRLCNGDPKTAIAVVVVASMQNVSADQVLSLGTDAQRTPREHELLTDARNAGILEAFEMVSEAMDRTDWVDADSPPVRTVIKHWKRDHA